MLRSFVILVIVLLKQTVSQTLPLTADCGQLEPISAGEVELIPIRDDSFDESLTTSVARPARNPVQATVAKLYNDTVNAGTIVAVVEPLSGCQNDTGSDGSGVTQLTAVNLYVRYLQYQDWYIGYRNCCPASQNYGCRSVKTLMPCFYYNVNGLLGWCCPLQRISISNCNCGKCALLCRDCFYTGQCQKRYTYTRYSAVCYIRSFWTTIVNFARYLPTSCYCKLI